MCAVGNAPRPGCTKTAEPQCPCLVCPPLFPRSVNRGRVFDLRLSRLPTAGEASTMVVLALGHIGFNYFNTALFSSISARPLHGYRGGPFFGCRATRLGCDSTAFSAGKSYAPLPHLRVIQALALCALPVLLWVACRAGGPTRVPVLLGTGWACFLCGRSSSGPDPGRAGPGPGRARPGPGPVRSGPGPGSRSGPGPGVSGGFDGGPGRLWGVPTMGCWAPPALFPPCWVTHCLPCLSAL